MDPFSTKSGAVRAETAAAPRAGGVTSALALAASAVKQATLNILRFSGSLRPSQAEQIELIAALQIIDARFLAN
jgi:signal transduction histidine kinase